MFVVVAAFSLFYVPRCLFIVLYFLFSLFIITLFIFFFLMSLCFLLCFYSTLCRTVSLCVCLPLSSHLHALSHPPLSSQRALCRLGSPEIAHAVETIRPTGDGNKGREDGRRQVENGRWRWAGCSRIQSWAENKRVVFSSRYSVFVHLCTPYLVSSHPGGAFRQLRRCIYPPYRVILC